jgi:hypothetical protein
VNAHHHTEKKIVVVGVEKEDDQKRERVVAERRCCERERGRERERERDRSKSDTFSQMQLKKNSNLIYKVTTRLEKNTKISINIVSYISVISFSFETYNLQKWQLQPRLNKVQPTLSKMCFIY